MPSLNQRRLASSSKSIKTLSFTSIQQEKAPFEEPFPVSRCFFALVWLAADAVEFLGYNNHVLRP